MFRKNLFIVQAKTPGAKHYKVNACSVKGAIHKAVRCDKKVFSEYKAINLERYSAEELWNMVNS